MHLESAGISAREYDGGALDRRINVLIVGPGGGERLKLGRAAAIADWLKSGGHLLGDRADQQDAAALPSLKIGVQNREHIGTFFKAFDAASPFAGIGPADVYNRDPREYAACRPAAPTAIGDGIAGHGRIGQCRLSASSCRGNSTSGNII